MIEAIVRKVVCVMNVWQPQVDTSKCTGCGECAVACPNHALAVVSAKAVLMTPQQCSYCGVCEVICPTSAIELPYLICFASSDNNKDQVL